MGARGTARHLGSCYPLLPLTPSGKVLGSPPPRPLAPSSSPNLSLLTPCPKALSHSCRDVDVGGRGVGGENACPEVSQSLVAVFIPCRRQRVVFVGGRPKPKSPREEAYHPSLTHGRSRLHEEAAAHLGVACLLRVGLTPASASRGSVHSKAQGVGPAAAASGAGRGSRPSKHVWSAAPCEGLHASRRSAPGCSGGSLSSSSPPP